MEKFTESNEIEPPENSENDPARADSQESKTQNESLIDVIITITKIEIIVDLMQKIDFETVARILAQTPVEHRKEKNYQVLLVLTQLQNNLKEIFSVSEFENLK